MSEMRLESDFNNDTSSSLMLFIAAPLMGAAAGGMGWGIRGQYGHEWGVMVPGALVAFTMVFLFCRHSTSRYAARAVALTALAMSFGGMMTYGQTVGLSHDRELIGNVEAFRWGMVGLFVKGGLWIGFAGAFLGIGLGGKQYSWKEMAILFIGLLFLAFVGIQLLNRPYVPGSDRNVPWYFFSTPGDAERALPWIYFSDHWHWEPDKEGLDPRPEIWGGLLAALVGLVAYVSFVKRDKLARNMTFFGVLGGGLGFTTGQMLQNKHSWTPGWLSDVDQSVHQWMPSVYPEEFLSVMGWNWWNMMETTFGAVMGFVLGFGLWLNRKLVVQGDVPETGRIHVKVEWVLIAIYSVMLFLWSVPRYQGEIFEGYPIFELFAGYPMAMGLLPVVCIMGGRYWPYIYALPMVTIPIAGITLKARGGIPNPDESEFILVWTMKYLADTPFVSFLLFLLPLAIMTAAALFFERRGRAGQTGRTFTRYGLILSAIIYCSLNFVFFGLPWATLPAGGRHTNAWIFLRCAELLVIGALFLNRPEPRLVTENSRTEP